MTDDEIKEYENLQLQLKIEDDTKNKLDKELKMLQEIYAQNGGKVVKDKSKDKSKDKKKKPKTDEGKSGCCLMF